MRVEWSQRSIRDVISIWSYIQRHNSAAAERVRDRIVTALEFLAARPRIGRPGRIPNTREFVFTDIPYIGVYEIDETEGQVVIMRVVHTARFYPPREGE